MNGSSEYFIDSNIFLRVLIREDEKTYQECSRVLSLIKNSDVMAYTSTLVMAEINWVLANVYKTPKQTVIPLLNSISRLPQLHIVDQYHFEWGMALYEAHSVKFIDAMIAAHSLVAINHIPVVSYDKDFDKLGVKRITPSELIHI